MVTTERSAPSDWEERPSILARLRTRSAKHPLRPEDGSPPSLCDPDEIPIVWAQHEDAPNYGSLEKAQLNWTQHALGRIGGLRVPPRDPDVETAAADAVIRAMGALQDAIEALNVSRGSDVPATPGSPEVKAALEACYQVSLET